MKNITRLFYILFLSTLLQNCSPPGSKCSNILNAHKNNNVHGVIYTKDVMPRSHNTERLLVKSDKKHWTLYFYRPSLDVRVWNACEVGDSIAKEQGSLAYHIFKPDSSKVTIELTCP